MTPSRAEELLNELDKDKIWTYAELGDYWKCPTTTAGQRVRTGRNKYGIFIKIVRKSPKKKAPRPNQDTRTVPWQNMGNPALPLCPRCLRDGRRGMNNSPVHYSRVDKFVYCQACGHEPEPLVELPTNGNGKGKRWE